MTLLAFTAAMVLHLLAVVIWVGGMFFAHLALRPAAAGLAPEIRLPFWGRVFSRFFPWVWLSIAVILATGYGTLFLFLGGLSDAKIYIYVMAVLGNVMILLFLYLWQFPYQALQTALMALDVPTAGRHQVRIRQIITINLTLGIITTVVAVAGRWW